MKFIYYGPFSGGTETHVAMGVGFRGRTPSEVTDPAAIAWLTGNPEYEQVIETPEDLEEEKPAKKVVPAKRRGRPKKGAE
jgi:hypothetical protein